MIFSLSQISGGGPSKIYTHFITAALRNVAWEKFCEDTPTSPEVIGAHTVNFKPNFKFSRLNFLGGEPLSQLGRALARFSQSLARVKIWGRSTPKGTWTFRTLDYSYPGLFVPSWTVRTMDYSYHHSTIRTVMQDSQKLTFPVKMCLCSVWVKPPWIFLTFSPNSWDFLDQILLSDYTFLSRLDYKFLFNYLHSATSTKLCHIKRDHHRTVCSKCHAP